MNYPLAKPFNSGRLTVSELHEIAFWEFGNPGGKVAVYLHGGPGAGCKPSMASFFNPQKYRVILFDQRGCGLSTPHAELRENTTADLIADMEKLRRRLAVEKWLVCGGSWGSALALAYAQKHPSAVGELILRGVFTLRREELLWFYQQGASWIFADGWEDFIAPIPPDERDDLIAAYHRRLTGDDENEKIKCAIAWSRWEAATLSILPDEARLKEFSDEKFALAFARIECHYFVNGGFFAEGQLLNNAHRLQDIPCAIVQGRYDVVTPMKTAWQLRQKMPTAEFHLINDAGHAAGEKGIAAALQKIADKFAKD